MADVSVTLKGKNGDPVIYIAGSINSTNASDFNDRLIAAMKEAGGGCTIDMAGLEYISSVGLRVFLGISQGQEEKLHMVNVQPEIFEIFCTTGFDMILDLKPIHR